MGALEIIAICLTIFVALKLTKMIAWSWWWVLAPALIYFLIIGLLMVLIYLLVEAE